MVADSANKNGLVLQLGDFISRLSYSDLPPEAIEAAKGRILDTVACCLAGRDLPESRLAASLARECPGNSRVFGYSFEASAADAAVANAVTAHSTAQDDIVGGVVHPGSVVVPAAFAVAEQEKAVGSEMVLAVVLGYEFAWRLYKATGGLQNQAFRAGTVFTNFGSATAAGKLMKLGEKQMANALGYAATLTLGAPNEGWWTGTMEPFFETGLSARLGIQSAVLARAGATVAPTVLDGRHGFFNCWAGKQGNLAELTSGLGRDFAVGKIYMKPFAACGSNQVPIQVASTLAKHKLKGADIARVVERLRPGARDYAGVDCPGPFTTHAKALMSMQFCAAAAILGRPLNTPEFTANSYQDPEVNEVASKVELVSDPGRTAPRFEVYTKDGKVLVAEEARPDRSIHVPTASRMQEKLRTLGAARLRKEAIEEVIELVMGLEKVSDVRDLTRRLQG